LVGLNFNPTSQQGFCVRRPASEKEKAPSRGSFCQAIFLGSEESLGFQDGGAC